MSEQVNENTGEIIAPAALGQMPSGMIAAICQVMGAVGRLAKDQRNQHGNYPFAGIDAFLAATGTECAAAGLVITQQETNVEVRGDWFFIDYDFWMHHESGSWGPITKQQMVMAKMGPQAFGAAQSYALKNLLRGLFQISTGDSPDIDNEKPEPLPQRQRRSRQQSAGLTEAMVADVLKAVEGTPGLTVDSICRSYGVESLGGIPKAKIAEVKKRIADFRCRQGMERVKKSAEMFVGSLPQMTDVDAVVAAACTEAGVDPDAITAEDVNALERTLKSWEEALNDE